VESEREERLALAATVPVPNAADLGLVWFEN
jgi:hypothetical protein